MPPMASQLENNITDRASIVANDKFFLIVLFFKIFIQLRFL
jgi:hypothetical protein